MRKKYTDTELLDWLQKKSNEGSCPGLVNDDFGHWVVSFSGFQNIPSKTPADIMTSFFVKKKEWCNSVRAAIIKVIKEEEKNKK